MDRGRRDRVRASVLAVTGALALATTADVVGSAVAGFDVRPVALVVALGASWSCLLVLTLLPRAVEVMDEAPRVGREVDPVTAMLRYDSEHDDAHVRRDVDAARSWAVLVIEVDAHVAAAAIDPGVADALIAGAAERITDIAASYGGIVRRLHGPQFVVIVGGLEEAALTALAGRLHDTSAQPGQRTGQRAAQIGRLVVGVAVAGEGRGEVSDLIRSAGAATCQAKRLASDVPVFFHDRLAEEARERLAVGRALSAAIGQRHIDLVYQPQIDLVDGNLLAVEVLARWHDPVFGPIAADRFVTIAVELGLSHQLDRLIFEKALIQLQDWDAAGVRVPRICVNVAAATITDGEAVGICGRMLRRHGIAPDRVTVQVMESRVIDGGIGPQAVQRFRDLGVRVALDDFGSGQSSFGQLVALPVTGLTIDRSLLSDHDADPAMLGAIIQAGTALGLAVGAVGIETVEQRDLVRDLGCVVGQGHLFSRPLSAAELVEWMRAPTAVA